MNAQLPASRLAIDCLVEAGGWGDADGPLADLARRAATAAVRRGMADASMVDASMGGATRVAAGRRPEVELTLVLADDPAVRALNAQWRGKDRPTNVLSFPNCTPEEIARARNGGPPLLLGDVVLALETCQAEAREQGKPLADHLAHLVVHGVLHLFGHEHEADAEAERMEMLEVAILDGLGIADPYRDDQL